jgi:hypothetical protein
MESSLNVSSLKHAMIVECTIEGPIGLEEGDEMVDFKDDLIIVHERKVEGQGRDLHHRGRLQEREKMKTTDKITARVK